MPDDRKTNRVQQPAGGVGHVAGQPSTAPSLESELRGLMERVLRAHKAEAVAADVDRKRSTIYRWCAHPGDIPAGALFALADLDPDPEALARIAGCLLAQALLIVQETSPGKWTRR